MPQLTPGFLSRSAVRTALAIAALAGAAGLIQLFGQGRVVHLPAAPTGGVVAHATGRLVGGGGLNGEYEIVCYFTFIDGLGTALFSGDAGERNAMFTLRTERFKFQTMLNAPLIHFGRLATAASDPPLIRVYYSGTPNRDFARPETFSQGQVVAVFRTRGIQGDLAPSLHFRAAGTMTLESSSEFTLNGRVVNVRGLGDAVTATLSGVAPSATEFAGASALSVPLSSTMVAAGRFRE
jgi:hypothetical protein